MAASILNMKDRYSVRDIAAALHITPGRVSQIVNKPDPEKPQLQVEDLRAEFSSRADRASAEQRRVKGEVALSSMQSGSRR
jgi:predicted transcriptional regulator